MMAVLTKESEIKSVLRKVLLNKENITDNDNPLDSKFIKKMNALDQEDIFDTIKRIS
jgi:hypothetical protein